MRRADEMARSNNDAGIRTSTGLMGRAATRRPGAGAGAVPFVCLVTKDGGSAGSDSTNCSYTYTAKDIDDSTVLGSSLTPLQPRSYNAEYWYAGEDRGSSAYTTRYAIAFYDLSGSIKLLSVPGEYMKDTECE